MLISINVDNPHKKQIREVVNCLREDGVIIYPTDTAYGLGCDIHSKKAIEKIYFLKKLSTKKPLSFICKDISEVSKYTVLTNFGFRILKKCLPGPYTFLLSASDEVPKIMLNKRKIVGVRIPDNNICRDIITELGNPILSTTLKYEDEEEAETDEDALLLYEPFTIHSEFKNRVDMVIDGGYIEPDQSTIIDLTEDTINIVREGKGDLNLLLGVK